MAVLKYKDPTTQQFVALTNYTVQPITPVQTTGSSTTEVMSQNAVTNELGNKANSSDVYTKTNVNNLIFGQDNVPSGSGEATNVTELINKTVYGTTTPSQSQTSASVVTTENLATTLSDYATTSAIANFFDGAEYGDGTLAGNTGKKVIAFKHGNTVKVEVDATPFIKDGMLDSATIGNATISGETVKCLILTFNTDSGKNAINIPINDIFNADNYVAKSEVDTIVAGSISDAVNPDGGSQSVAQKALTDAISAAVAKAIEDALNSGGEVVNQINNTIEGYTYTPQGGSAISLTDVMESSHTHTNKGVLDGITAEKVAAWDSASSGGVTNVAYTNKKITKTVGGTTTDVVTAATIVSDGGGITALPGGNITGTPGAGKTFTAFSQTNGQVNATLGDISITKSQVSDLGTIGDAAAKSVDTTISSGSTSVNLPTSSAVASFVEGKGYKTVDTTYTFAEGTTNGAFNVTPSGGSTQSVTVHGLGTAAYADTNDFLAANGKAASATVADSANSVALANVSNADDLQAIEALAGTSGLLRKTAANTWELDTTAYTTNTGTVTSVGITVPPGLAVTGSPITTSGTLAIALENGYVIPQQTTLDSFLKGTVEVVSVTADNNSYNAGTIAEGTQKHVIFNNGGNADYIVTIPTTYHTPDGQAIELTVPNGGYAEANFMNINGTIYARGI